MLHVHFRSRPRPSQAKPLANSFSWLSSFTSTISLKRLPVTPSACCTAIMPLKRKPSNCHTKPAVVPPSLPPSVEEAYRRKCVQLKNRTSEVEDANDAARLRLARIKRQVEKLRIERAFLLEQLAKRTSANVEDSEGSPSPPPTVRRQPARSPVRSSAGSPRVSLYSSELQHFVLHTQVLLLTERKS